MLDAMKNVIRKRMLVLRGKQFPAEKKKKDFAIARKLAAFLPFKRAREFFTYISHESEVSTDSIILKYFGGKKIIAPKMKNSGICLHEIKNPLQFVRGKFGIREPKVCLPLGKVKEIEIALIPAIAFDLDGHRIGYGGGHFDRLLSRLKCVKVGLAYEFQIIDKVPAHPYDVPVNFIITEKRIIICKLFKNKIRMSMTSFMPKRGGKRKASN